VRIALFFLFPITLNYSFSNPEELSPVYLFKNFHSESQDQIILTGPLVNPILKKIESQGIKERITWNDYDKYSKIALSVFRSKSSTKNGTSFLVSPNIILTNAHLFSAKESLEKNCSLFSIKLNHKDEDLYCKKIHFCSFHYDFCAIEINKKLLELPLFSLSSKPADYYNEKFAIIGNNLNQGIQLSLSRKGIISGNLENKANMIHLANVDRGSSGSPLINLDNEVIGVQHSSSKKFDQKYATRSDIILDKIKKNAPEIYDQLKIDQSLLDFSINRYWKEILIEEFTHRLSLDWDYTKVIAWPPNMIPLVSFMAPKEILKKHQKIEKLLIELNSKKYILNFLKCNNQAQMSIDCIFEKEAIIKEVIENFPDLTSQQVQRVSNHLISEVSKEKLPQILKIIFPW
jgi:hypothetical protein